MADHESDEQERKLFVGGLNKDMTDEEGLRTFFNQWGAIVDATIMRDMDKVSRGFGFILFESYQSVDSIMDFKRKGEAFCLDGHTIEVKRALPKAAGTQANAKSGGMSRKIFVGGLASTATDADVTDYFGQFGKVSEVELLKDRDTGRLRGFAFVTFEEEDSADRCIQKRLHLINKKNCEVKRAQTRANLTKEEDDDRRRGGGGGRNDRNDRGGDQHRGDSRDSRDRDHRDSRRGRSRDRSPPSNSGNNTQGMMDMATVNQLIAEAHLQGLKQGLAQAAQLGASSQLAGFGGGSALGGMSAGLTAQAQPSPLLQALMQSQNQQAASVDSSRDSRGESRSGAAGASSYTTTYPAPGSYDLYYQQQSGYGPAKDDHHSTKSTRDYRPY